MAERKPKNDRTRTAKTKNGHVRRVRVKPNEDLSAVYARIRRQFTAADLQRYTEIEEGIPAEKVLAEMRSIHREETRKRKA